MPNYYARVQILEENGKVLFDDTEGCSDMDDIRTYLEETGNNIGPSLLWLEEEE